MIDEPIILYDVYGKSVFEMLSGKTEPTMIFEAYGFPSKDSISCYLPNQENITESFSLFGIHKEFGENNPCWIGDPSEGSGRWTTYEELVDFLEINYPDYLEWFLFHPEWLS